MPFAFLIFAAVMSLSLFLSLDFPWASPFLCLQCTFVILGYMRILAAAVFEASPRGIHQYSKLPTKDYFTATAMSFSICGTIMLAIWIGWRMNINIDLQLDPNKSVSFRVVERLHLRVLGAFMSAAASAVHLFIREAYPITAPQVHFRFPDCLRTQECDAPDLPCA